MLHVPTAAALPARLMQLRAAGRVLSAAGVIRPQRPDRLAKALTARVRFGSTAAVGYEIGSVLTPQRAALIDERGALTFEEVDARTKRLASALADRGVGCGTPVALMARNHRGFVETVVALSRLGADVLLLNTGSGARQLREVLDREGAEVVVYDEEFRDILGSALGGRTEVVAWTGGPSQDAVTLEGLIAAGGTKGLPWRPAQRSRVTILTSGTTGTPKGARRGSPGIASAVAILSAIPLRAGDRTLVCAPLFHQWGYAHFMLHLLLRTTLVLRRRFDAADALATIERERVRCAAMVPVMCQRLLDLDADVLHKASADALEVVAVSGSQLSPVLARRFMDHFGDRLYDLYGSTEVAWAAIAGPADLRIAAGTVGRAPLGTHIALYDAQDVQLVEPGQTGRIFVGNGMLFEGYTGGGGKPVLDGLMATGDVGHFDAQGRLHIDGRDDDMIVSGGENVFPQEVEEALEEHPDVREVAVIGVEDEGFGQRLAAFVVAEREVAAEALRAHVKTSLAGYKAPRDIVFVAELPRSEQGKVLKRLLRQQPS